ncbi:TonB-dependent receptor domain-containing protein [Tamlana fucoidanivorans]|uniref:TonB-dependent receptor domain-containing protein n=1 Tax=Allotamlana fucoidanivorans TaxID=2583814 RepID=UPI001E2EA7A3|nr:TonB-dependent receptor [Tamlana fucoidanivorans]
MISQALFSELEFNNQETYARLDIRANYFQKFNAFILEPRLNIRQKLSHLFAVKLQGEFKNQSVTQIIDFQDDFLGVENRRWILANTKNVPISKSKQASLGFEYNHRNWILDVEGYYKVVNGITLSNEGFYNNFQYLKASGRYKVKGLEFLVNKTASHYSTWLSYTYSVNDYEFKILNPPVFPNNMDIRHSVSLAFNYNILEPLEISLGGIWRSGKPYTKPVEGHETIQNGNDIVVNYGDPNRDNLEDFMRLDASLNYGFNLSKGMISSVRVGVINILNRKNVINTYYEVNPEDSSSAIAIENKSLGLTPNVSFRCHF